MIIQKVVLPVLFLFGPVLASAQIGGGAGSGSASTQGQWFSSTASFSGMPMPAASVTGMPFSGVREYEHTQTLADGTHISQKNVLQKIWRDADGRMRTERPMGRGPNMPEPPSIVEITDPVAGYRYTLDTQNKIAHRVGVRQRPAPPPAPTAPGTATRPGVIGSLPPSVSVATQDGGGIVTRSGPVAKRIQSEHESLGTNTIDGLLVEGTKWTHTIPEGTQGNDRPISTITESWFSPELREAIESTTSDPRSGETVTRLTNIDRNNPDPSLFQVPADYQIVDEQGAFSINYHR